MKGKPTAAENAVTVVDISDPTAANTGVELLDLDAVQLQSLPLRVRRVMIRLESAAVVFHSTNLRVRTRTSVRSGFLAYVTFGPQAHGTINGLPVRPGLLLAAESEMENTLVAEGGWESITFLLPPEDILAHLTARQRAAEFHVPEGAEPLQADPESVRRLFDWGKLLVDTALFQPALFGEQMKERVNAQNELLETPLATLRVADGFESTRPHSPGTKCHRETAETMQWRSPATVLRDRPLQGRAGERTDTGVRVQGDHGIEPRDLPVAAQAASRTAGAPGCDARIDDGHDRGAQLGLLAFRRILARI
jgi:hypothetical protein